MKITAIRVEHLLGVRDVDVSLRHPVTIFCGKNDVGKTSIQEAIRLAFTGEAVRVKLKKDYGAMLRTGAKNGVAAIEFAIDGRSGRATATLPSFKQDCTPPAPPQLPFVLDAPRFAQLDDATRRRFLFDLFGVRANMQDVAERLSKKGCPDDIIKIVVPVLRTGFEAAEKYAADQLTHWRATWKGITGETYGEQKAETWKAPLAVEAEGQDEQIKGLDVTIHDLERELGELNREVGAGQSFLKQRDEYEARATDLKAKSANLAKLKRDVDQTEKAIPKARKTMEQAKEKVQRARMDGQACPACGALLSMDAKGKLIELEEKKTKTQLTSLEADATEASSALETLEGTLKSLQKELNEAMQAAAQLSALEGAMASPVTVEKLKELQQQAEGTSKDIGDLREKRRVLVEAERQVREAKDKTKNAAEAHRKFKEWSVAKALFAPDGIPGEILSETLGPLNTRLRASAEFTGWPEPQLRGDMEIMVGGLPYALQGESVRWRVDAMMAEAIAHAARLQMLVLDRIDVLHPLSRGELLDWCYHLAESQGYETVLLFGTLKEKPKLEDANVFWLEGGRVA